MRRLGLRQYRYIQRIEKNVPTTMHADEIVANGGPSAYIVGIVELVVVFEKVLLDSLLICVIFVSSFIFEYVSDYRDYTIIYIFFVKITSTNLFNVESFLKTETSGEYCLPCSFIHQLFMMLNDCNKKEYIFHGLSFIKNNIFFQQLYQ